MTKLEKNIRFFIGTTIGNSQALFWINEKREKERNKLLDTDSNICIEGFHRSGNSFFVLLFKRSNKGVKIAHHTHAAAQVIKAVESKVPTIVLIRKPEDSIASLIVWDENLSISIAIRAWISFYQSLQQYKNRFHLTTFEEVTENPTDVIKDLNSKYNTNFTLLELNEEQLLRMKSGFQANKSRLSAPLPTIEKDQAKLKYYDSIKGHRLFPKAKSLYEQFVYNVK